MVATALTGTGNVTEGATNSGTSVTINKPANVSDGTLMIAAVYNRAGTAAYSTPPSGWTVLAACTNTLVGWHALYYKVAGGSEPSDYTWAGGGSGRHAGIIFIVTGADTSSLLDASGGYATWTSVPDQIDAPGISPTSSDALLLGFTVLNTTGNDPGTFTAPTGMTTVGDSSTATGGSDSTAYVAFQELSASGATGNRLFPVSGTSTAASGQSLLAAINSSTGPVTYDLTITHDTDSADIADRTYEIDATGSSGTVTLTQTSGTTVSDTESPTGVFTFADPGGSDDLVFDLDNTSNTLEITIRRGIFRPATLTFKGGTVTDVANWS